MAEVLVVELINANRGWLVCVEDQITEVEGGENRVSLVQVVDDETYAYGVRRVPCSRSPVFPRLTKLFFQSWSEGPLRSIIESFMVIVPAFQEKAYSFPGVGESLADGTVTVIIDISAEAERRVTQPRLVAWINTWCSWESQLTKTDTMRNDQWARLQMQYRESGRFHNER